MTKAEAFWSWFDQNKDKYLNLEVSNQEELLDELLEELQKYHPELYYEIAIDEEYEDNQLIISAEGVLEYFPVVEELVAASPIFEEWTIFALKPPKGFDFELEHKDVVLKPSDLIFMPLEHPEHPGKLGLQIAIPSYKEDEHEDYLWSAEMLLEACLGEKASVMEIDYVDVCGVKGLPDKMREAMVEFTRLREYIDWYRGRLN